MKNKDLVLIEAKKTLNSFVQGRIYDINHNIEHVNLSIALIDKYSKGIIDAIYFIFKDECMCDSLKKFTENKLDLITTEWRIMELRRINSMDVGIKYNMTTGDYHVQ